MSGGWTRPSRVDPALGDRGPEELPKIVEGAAGRGGFKIMVGVDSAPRR
ncbi:hypothetical protein [Pseudonocardia sp. ICBG1142]|nr:hypothetical protein [Pseudonocardia sp. ICBG1142]